MRANFAADPDYVAMVESVLAETEASQPDAGVGIDRSKWSELAALGLTRLTGREDLGGSGGTWVEAAPLHYFAGYHRIALPLAEHDLLAGWLSDELALRVDSAMISSLVVRQPDKGQARVPYGRYVDRVLVVEQAETCRVVELEGDLEWQFHENIAGEPRDRWIGVSDSGSWTEVPGRLVDELHLRGALVRSLQICGALGRTVDIAVDHALNRHQFGRPLMKFQAVQALLADAAAESALAWAATLAAVDTMGDPNSAGSARRQAVAVAKSSSSHAAGVVCRSSHQVLGAIGFTVEHELHRHTRRLLAWRDEYGTRDEWDRALLDDVIHGGTDLWDAVVGR